MVTSLNPGVLAPIHAAARAGHVSCLNMLLNAGIAVNAISSTGATSLHYAAFGGHTAVMQALFEKGADVDASDSTGQTPLAMSVIKGDVGGTTLLLSKGAAANIPTDKTLMTPLHLAAQHGFSNLVALLSNTASVSINTQDAQKRTALHWACFLGDMSAVLALLEHGADPLITDGNSHTTIEVAMAKQYTEIVEVLMAKIGSSA